MLLHFRNSKETPGLLYLQIYRRKEQMKERKGKRSRKQSEMETSSNKWYFILWLFLPVRDVLADFPAVGHWCYWMPTGTPNPDGSPLHCIQTPDSLAVLLWHCTLPILKDFLNGCGSLCVSECLHIWFSPHLTMFLV